MHLLMTMHNALLQAFTALASTLVSGIEMAMLTHLF